LHLDRDLVAAGGFVRSRSLLGKVVVLTGASSGFGKGAALAFADAGASLVLAARRDHLLDDLVAECEALGATARAVPTDVSRPTDVEALAQTALVEFGRIDVWINNAGVGALGPFEKIPLADHTQVIATDLLGTLFGSWHAYRRFLEQGSGVLINVASELGQHTVPYYASYAAAKHGVVGLGESLRQELEERKIENVHVCTVLPTAHDTPFFDHAANYTGHEVTPPKPLHDPENVIQAIVRLARNPKDEEIVGGDGVTKILMKRLAPRIARKMSGRLMHMTQIEKPPPAPDSPGAVRAPTETGTGVSAGRRRGRKRQPQAQADF
jgi:NAD(P)-dependent dehydrogenase (short-subunit alcohol dehydrogenase family)